MLTNIMGFWIFSCVSASLEWVSFLALNIWNALIWWNIIFSIDILLEHTEFDSFTLNMSIRTFLFFIFFFALGIFCASCLWDANLLKFSRYLLFHTFGLNSYTFTLSIFSTKCILELSFWLKFLKEVEICCLNIDSSQC